MAGGANRLPDKIRKKYEKARTDGQIFGLQVIRNVGDYLGVCHSITSSQKEFWFRGHGDYEWSLTPSALRYPERSDRDTALKLVKPFKRITESRFPNPPRQDEELKWVQLAQHYGLPTRLLDWTKNAAAALFFACSEPKTDGLVFVLNPVDLNRWTDPRRPRVFDTIEEARIVERLLTLDGRKNPRGPRTIALDPVLNSERIMLQRGCFTLHGAREFALTDTEAPGLLYIPILKGFKEQLLDQLGGVGIDEMSLFPEAEHTCNYLRRSFLPELPCEG